MTDPYFQSLRYHLAQYQRNGLTNHSGELRVSRVGVTKLTLDAYYESITVRIFAEMLDWTTNAEGEVVGGSAQELREFSEYWTFVRAAGCSAGIPADMETCPSCGAALDRVSIGGVCGYCDTRIASAEQTWVLSQVTQDEVYG